MPHLCRPYGSLTDSNLGAASLSYRPAGVEAEGSGTTSASLIDSDTFRANVYAELDVLRRRIFALEDMHSRITCLEAQNQRAEYPRSAHAVTRSRENSGDNLDVEGDAAVTLEYSALGTDRRNPDRHEEIQPNGRASTPVSQSDSKATLC